MTHEAPSTDDTEARFTYPLPRLTPTAPHPEYARLSREEPVCPIRLATGDPAWLLTRHDDVKAMLVDRRFSRKAVFEPGAPRAQPILPDPNGMLAMDPPEHTRVRKLAALAFTPKHIAEMTSLITATVADLLDGMAAGDRPADLLDEFARPLALTVVCAMLGVPFADNHRFASWCDHFMSLTRYTGEQMAKANADMRGYFRALIEHKRAEPATDLISTLVAVHDADGTISEEEIISTGVLLLLAGHDTTVTVLGGGVANLLSNPDQLALLRADPSLWPAAVEEMARLSGPGGGMSIRIALADIPMGGRVIPAGSAVLAFLGSASRDESVFDEPDRFRVDRPVTSQLSFGHGPHFCIGAALARAELLIGARTLFERFPTLRLAIPIEQLQWKDYAALGGWESLPVSWDG